MPENSTTELLVERKSTHGDYLIQSAVGQALKAELFKAPNYFSLSANKRDALDMIAVKISRILCGDSEHDDHWDDIAGYALLGKLRA